MCEFFALLSLLLPIKFRPTRLPPIFIFIHPHTHTQLYEDSLTFSRFSLPFCTSYFSPPSFTLSRINLSFFHNRPPPITAIHQPQKQAAQIGNVVVFPHDLRLTFLSLLTTKRHLRQDPHECLPLRTDNSLLDQHTRTHTHTALKKNSASQSPVPGDISSSCLTTTPRPTTTTTTTDTPPQQQQ